MLKKWSSWIILIFIQIVFWILLYTNEEKLLMFYDNITLTYHKIIYYFSSKVNFPVGELFYLILFIGLVFIIKRVSRKSNLNDKLVLVSKTIFFIILVYNSLWGLVNYKSNFILETDKSKLEINDLKTLYFSSLNNAKDLRNEIEIKAFDPLEFKYNYEDYINDLQRNLQQLKSEDWIKNYHIPTKLVIKESYISNLLSHFGVLGYYNPFTIESNINSKNTHLKIPFTIAHEVGHQMGFATENEANFIAYYLGINSKIKEVQYAAHFKTTFSLLNAIYPHDSVFVKNQLKNLPLTIKSDRETEIAYYKKYDGNLNEIFSSLNNQFLKANNQDGVISYSKYIELIYNYNLKKKANHID